MEINLQNPPLVEALLEIKWELRKTAPDTFQDPGYKLASGRLFDRIREKFGYIKDLPTTLIPEEITPYAVRNQFRVNQDGWPLIQLGPGIASVNFTSPYTWKDFRSTVEFFIPNLVDSYKGVVPDQPDFQLNINNVVLRYINSVDVDWTQRSILDFIKENLHTTISLPTEEKENKFIDGLPGHLNFEIGYPINDPMGRILLRFASGNVGQTKSVIWEIICASSEKDAPQVTDMQTFIPWLNSAHDTIEHCFYSLVKGDLLERFKG